MRDALRSLEGSDDEKDDPDADEDASTDEAEKSEDEVEEVKENWANKAKGPWQNMWFRSDQYSESCRKAKMEDMWGRLVPDPSTNDVEPNPYWYAKHPNFFTQNANGSFCQNSDVLGRKRPKTTHTQGLVAKVQWVPTKAARETLTGIMSTGSKHIIMRLSETNNLSESDEVTTGLTPSMALKFFRDGDMSYNLFAMNSFLPTDSWNFFKYPLSNEVPKFDPETHPIEVATVLKKMVEANNRPFGTAIFSIAKNHVNGD